MKNHSNRSTATKLNKFSDALKKHGVEIMDDQITAAAKTLCIHHSQVDTDAIEASADKVGLNCCATPNGKFSVTVHITNQHNGGTYIKYSIKGRDVWIVVEDFDGAVYCEKKWCMPRPEVPKPELFFQELFANDLNVSVVLGIDPLASRGYCRDYWQKMQPLSNLSKN